MCDICSKIKLIDYFPDSTAYLECLSYIKDLVESGKFIIESQSCDIDDVIDENGHWNDDIISHVIVCKKCGKAYSCCCVTFRGGGSFRKGR